MRVLNMETKCAMEIEYAICDGKRLSLITLNNICYQTDDYCNENIAYSKLSDLVINGYIIVEKLDIKCT